MIFGAIIEKTYRNNKQEFVSDWVEITNDGRTFCSIEYTNDEDYISDDAISPIIVKKIFKRLDFTDDAGASIYDNFTIVSFDLQTGRHELSHKFGVFSFYAEGLRYELEFLDENGKKTNDMKYFCQFDMSNFKVVGNILDGIHKESSDTYGVKYYVKKNGDDNEVMSIDRLTEYGKNITEANLEDSSLPYCLKKPYEENRFDISHAFLVVEWFGEKITPLHSQAEEEALC